MSSPSPRQLALECTALFLCVPLAIALFKPIGFTYLILCLITIYCGSILYSDFGWRFKSDWNSAAITRPVVRRMLLRFVPFALLLLALTLVRLPDHFLILPREHKLLWLAVLLLYPPLSVIPQEIISRCFFLRRYASIFTAAHLPIASAIAFGWLHIVMLNWESIIISTIGGFLFVDTYTRTRSLAAVCLEHSIYGCFIFTVGLGSYFYHGNAFN